MRAMAATAPPVASSVPDVNISDAYTRTRVSYLHVSIVRLAANADSLAIARLSPVYLVQPTAAVGFDAVVHAEGVNPDAFQNLAHSG